MRLIDQLTPAPASKPEPDYQRHKIRPEFQGSERRYRDYLQQPRSAAQVARHMGYTYAGARCSLLRFVERGLAKVASEKGTRPVLYIWI